MEISKLYFRRLRNAAHYQFYTDFSTLVEKYTPQALSIEELYALYKPAYADEGIAFVAITKSAFTEDLEKSDKGRDQVYRGMVDDVNSKKNHFKVEVRDAATRIAVIMDSYGNLAPKPYDEESALLTSLISDLRTKTATEMGVLSLKEWIDELEVRNNAFIALQGSRNSEEADRTELRMKEARVVVDEAYKKIVKRISALIELNGDTAYTGFVKELNARIARSMDSIAQSGTKSTTPADAQKAE
jgi:hypothetical protein